MPLSLSQIWASGRFPPGRGVLEALGLLDADLVPAGKPPEAERLDVVALRAPPMDEVNVIGDSIERAAQLGGDALDGGDVGGPRRCRRTDDEARLVDRHAAG